MGNSKYDGDVEEGISNEAFSMFSKKLLSCSSDIFANLMSNESFFSLLTFSLQLPPSSSLPFTPMLDT
jgi:hypothetical protein